MLPGIFKISLGEVCIGGVVLCFQLPFLSLLFVFGLLHLFLLCKTCEDKLGLLLKGFVQGSR